MTRTRWLTCLTVAGLANLAFTTQSRADDKDILKRLEDKGAKVSTAKGALSISVPDCSQWSDADYKALGSVPHVTSLSLGAGFTESSLPSLAGLTDLEVFGTNGMQVTEEGVRGFTQFPKLQRLSFFHPPKTFTGAGLGQLVVLKHLEALTVAGSFIVGDDALASMSKIKSLKGVRMWHAGNTNEGVKRLKELPALESLTIGQRLTHTPPPCPDDETIRLLLAVKTLKTLVLMESRHGYESLVRLKQLPEFKQLHLDGVDISEADVERLKQEMPSVRITMTRPSELYMKRIDDLFGKK
jgi:hypothetical protein